VQSRSCIRGLFLLFAWLLCGPGAWGWGYTHAQDGTVFEDREMPTLAGGREHLLTGATANVFTFFRPNQDFSRMALKDLASLEKELAGKSIHWAVIVSDRADKAAAEAMVKEAGLSMPALVDAGDVLYGKLGVAQVPATVICDQQHRIVAYQPFTKVNYATIIRARVRNLLKEISDDELATTLKPPPSLTDSEEAAASRRLKLAGMLFQSKSYDKALQNVDLSIQENPSAAAYALRGDILAAEGKCMDAVPAFEQALKIDPQNARALQGAKACLEKRP